VTAELNLSDADIVLAHAAHRFAKVAHAGQTRKYMGDPYYEHVRAVARICAIHGLPVHIVAAACLHDTVEDTPVTLEVLAQMFPPDVVAAVAYMTDQCHDGNRRERKTAECARLATGTPEQQSLKLADLIDNTASIVEHDPKFAKTYLVEKRALLDALTSAWPSIRAEAEATYAAAVEKLEASR
jgi:(p)ppGpp synthase/HD superfamily hydrolase